MNQETLASIDHDRASLAVAALLKELLAASPHIAASARCRPEEEAAGAVRSVIAEVSRNFRTRQASAAVTMMD